MSSHHDASGAAPEAAEAGTVWTIGHSTHSLEAFVGLLHAHRIDVLVDVRTVPRSRRHPHFHTDALARELPAVGLQYRHLAALGGWRKAAADSPNGGWRNVSFQGYADYAMTAEFQSGLGELQTLASRSRPAVMCSEAVWWRCHRRLIADRLVLAGDPVLHIMAAGKATPHRISAFAEVRDGELLYPPA